MLDIIPIVLFAIIIVLFAVILGAILRKSRHIDPSIQEIRDTIDSLYQQTSIYEQEIRGIRREIPNRLKTLDLRIEALEAQIEEIKPLKIEEVESLLKQYYTSTLFDYQAPWWKDYSWLYRHVQEWRCEKCQLPLNSDRQYLHTHHLLGTQHNDPTHLRALCIKCHSEEPGENHQKLKEQEDYHQFMEKYGTQFNQNRT